MCQLVNTYGPIDDRWIVTAHFIENHFAITNMSQVYYELTYFLIQTEMIKPLVHADIHNNSKVTKSIF